MKRYQIVNRPEDGLELRQLDETARHINELWARLTEFGDEFKKTSDTLAQAAGSLAGRVTVLENPPVPAEPPVVGEITPPVPTVTATAAGGFIAVTAYTSDPVDSYDCQLQEEAVVDPPTDWQNTKSGTFSIIPPLPNTNYIAWARSRRAYLQSEWGQSEVVNSGYLPYLLLDASNDPLTGTLEISLPPQSGQTYLESPALSIQYTYGMTSYDLFKIWDNFDGLGTGPWLSLGLWSMGTGVPPAEPQFGHFNVDYGPLICSSISATLETTDSAGDQAGRINFYDSSKAFVNKDGDSLFQHGVFENSINVTGTGDYSCAVYIAEYSGNAAIEYYYYTTSWLKYAYQNVSGFFIDWTNYDEPGFWIGDTERRDGLWLQTDGFSLLNYSGSEFGSSNENAWIKSGSLTLYSFSADTPPFVLSGNNTGVLVTGLNADLLDGYHASAFALDGHNHDHGALAGLADDDHPQYMLRSDLGSGTDNYIPKFLVGATPTFADSIMSQDAGSTTVTVAGAMQHNGAVTVGVDDTGYDVTLYGATSGKRLLWDESGDTLDNTGWYSHAVTCDQETTASVSATQTASTLQSNTTGASVLDLVGNLWFAFKFTASGDHAVRGIKLYLKSSASLATDYGKYIVAYIYSDNAGLPNARISSGESTLFCPNITTSAGYRDWSATAALTSGTAYWIVLKFTALPAAGNVQLYYDATGTANYTTGGSGGAPSWAAASDGYYPQFYLTGRTYYAGSFVSDNNYGAYFYSTNKTAFDARSYNSYGVYARSENYIGIAGFSAYQYGVQGSSTYGYGVVGLSANSYGTYGSGSSGGVYGISTAGYGVYARSTDSYAVLGRSTNSICGWFQRNTSGVAANRPVLFAWQLHASDTNNAFAASCKGTGKAIYGYLDTALTDTVQNVMQLGHDTSGTPAAGFGAGILMSLNSSTTDTQDAARIAWTWVDSTHATRKANLILSVYDTAIRTGLTIAATGSGAALTADGTLTVGADDTGYDVTFYGATSGKKLLWDESADTLQVDGAFDLNGGATLGGADTDLLTCVGRLIVRTVADGDMDATAGTVAEVVFNSADSKFYGCTVSGSPATWAALN